VIDCIGHDQDKDPFFSGQVDWAVWDGLVAYGTKEEDGHGIYLSNGSDWNIVRFNETYGNVSSDFQINADPASTCAEDGIAYDDPQCDAYAGEGECGRGASDYFLIDGNYFHHSLGPGPNFTSVRRSIIRNNIFGPQARHNVSFWQETDNAKLGSSENKILHNLFITTGRHGVQFANHSNRKEFVNNVMLGLQIDGAKVTANPKALLMEVDETVGDNVYRRKPLCFRIPRSPRAQQRRGGAQGLLAGLVCVSSDKGGPHAERLHPDGQCAVPWPRQALSRRAGRSARRRALRPRRSRPHRNSLTSL